MNTSSHHPEPFPSPTVTHGSPIAGNPLPTFQPSATRLLRTSSHPTQSPASAPPPAESRPAMRLPESDSRLSTTPAPATESDRADNAPVSAQVGGGPPAEQPLPAAGGPAAGLSAGSRPGNRSPATPPLTTESRPALGLPSHSRLDNWRPAAPAPTAAGNRVDGVPIGATLDDRPLADRSLTERPLAERPLAERPLTERPLSGVGGPVAGLPIGSRLGNQPPPLPPMPLDLGAATRRPSAVPAAPAADWRVGGLLPRVAKGGKALVPYVTGGITADWTDYVVAYAAAGADAIEVGLPFSDPMLDGITIQQASDQALSRGTTLVSILSDISEIEVGVPLIAMTYANLVMRAGPDEFCARLRAAGITGLIVPDLPVDELGVVERAAADAGVALILLVAPVTPDDRLAEIVGRSRGFVYAVSRMGTTGERTDLDAAAEHLAARVRAVTSSQANRPISGPAVSGPVEGLPVGGSDGESNAGLPACGPDGESNAGLPPCGPDGGLLAGDSPGSGSDGGLPVTGLPVTGPAGGLPGSGSPAAGPVGGLPVLIGFGVSGPAQAETAGRAGDGVVVASALMRRVLEGATPDDLRHEVEALRAALDRAAQEDSADRSAHPEVSGHRG